VGTGPRRKKWALRGGVSSPQEAALSLPQLGQEADMSLLGWIFFGLLTGFIASRIVHQHGQGCLLNIALGVIGAFVGGFLFTQMGGAGITGFNLYSMFVAIIGAIVVLLIYHALTGRRQLP
jgi:uncharacterized membrane protein YeaQ/YmgE (transglycosylase-associated protein family)